MSNSSTQPAAYPTNLRWNMIRRGLKAKAVQVDGTWRVRVRWSERLGLELKRQFEKEPRSLVKEINTSPKGLLVNDEPNCPWAKVKGWDLDEGFLQPKTTLF